VDPAAFVDPDGERKNGVQNISAFATSIILVLQFLAAGLSFGDELIPPTRTLGGGEENRARLTVFSEPPGMDVYLDSSKVGVTPLWLGRVEPGIRTLRVEDKEAQIYLEEGKKVIAGFFKGTFVTREEEEVGVTPPPGLEKKPGARARAEERLAEKEQRRDLTRWDRFINGSLPFF
jgi:GMP synthase-like glutamine amidotransferase